MILVLEYIGMNNERILPKQVIQAVKSKVHGQKNIIEYCFGSVLMNEDTEDVTVIFGNSLICLCSDDGCHKEIRPISVSLSQFEDYVSSLVQQVNSFSKLVANELEPAV